MMNLGLLQLADSALPVSGYTHSWGLEAAIARKTVHDAESLERWTLQWLRTSLGPLEGVVVASACRAVQSHRAPELITLNRVLEVSILPATIRRASREMGEQLLALGRVWIWSAGRLESTLRAMPEVRGPWHYPVVFGLLGALAEGQPGEVLAAYLHQAAIGMISTGVRAVPVGHTHGQEMLAYLHGEIRALVRDIVDRDAATAGAGCPYYEVLCDEQTRLYARMFRS